MMKMITDRLDAILTRELVRAGITASQSRALGYLMARRGEAASQRDIERHLGVSHTTAKNVVRRLEENGWVSTAFNHEDGRLKIVSPTEKSVSMGREIEKRVQSIEDALMRGLGAGERKELARMLNHLYKNIRNQTKKQERAAPRPIKP